MAKQLIDCVNGYQFEKVRLEIENHIAVMTLHNPPVNTASRQLGTEIRKLCEYIDRNDDVWVCILCSDLKTFCVGMEIKELRQELAKKDVTNLQRVYYEGTEALYQLRVPLICAVHGHCLGGGLCYPASADICIAVKDTVFGVPEAKLSFIGGSGHLSRLIPPMIQRDMCYCGTTITAEELHNRFGGVTMVVDTRDELMPAAMKKAQELCKRSPRVLRSLKACMNQQEAFRMQQKDAAEMLYTQLVGNDDLVEGVTAFLEKRDPQYKEV